jgi:hypothetical protein
MAAGKKTGGKKAGSKNIATKVNQVFWQHILDKQENKIEKALNFVCETSPLDYLKTVISITEFVMPKLARMDGSVDVTNTTRLIRKKAND